MLSKFCPGSLPAYFVLHRAVVKSFKVDMAEDAQSEEIAKYKRVLALARSSLEANQATIAVKDQQIAQLIKALEEEKSSNKTKKVLGREEEASLTPRRILCRVDVEDTIWILIEYDDSDDAWKSFESEQDLEDFIQRVPGVPLSCPTRCLSSEESNRIVGITLYSSPLLF